MKKLLLFLLITGFLSYNAYAQCDANFTYSINQNQVTFNSASTYSTAKHTWFFGDGYWAMFQANPVHNYNQPGNYTVTHIVQDSVHGCVDSIFIPITLNFIDSCSVTYTYVRPNPNAGQYIFYPHINALDSNSLNISWTINGVQASTSYSLNHTFAPGGYVVCVSIQNDSTGCSAQYCDSVFYQPNPDSCNLNASFTYHANPSLPSQITFTALPDQPRLKYQWKFGDNSTGSGRIVSHYYNQTGNYSVLLVVTDTLTNCKDSVNHLVTITRPDSCNLNASFTWQANPSQLRQISFTALPNQPYLNYKWDFGDNTTGSGRTVTHLYNQQANYNVRLIVTDSVTNCKDTAWVFVSTWGSPDSCTASFTYTTSPGQISFTAVSNQIVSNYLWYIWPMPDSVSNRVDFYTANPVYNPPHSGLYYVCLRILTRSGCIRWYCDSIWYNNDSIPPVDSLTARIAVIPSYPNPVNLESQIKFNLNLDRASLITYKVSSLSGNIIYQASRQGQSGPNTISIPVQQLGRGQYFIDIIYGNIKKRSVFQKL